MDVLVRLLNAALMIALPLALGVFLARRYRVGWRLYGIGALTFVGAQVLHLPFNQWVLNPIFIRMGLNPEEVPTGWALVGYGLALGLSAGVFEECARYLVLRRWLPDVRSWRRALMFGAGHGGVEAILLGGLALYGLVQALALRGADLQEILPPEQVELARAQLAVYWDLPWTMAILGAVERAFALTAHVFMTVLVLQAFTRRRLIWLGAAIAWHALLDAVAVIVYTTWGAYAAEGAVFVIALLSLAGLLALRSPEAPGAPRAEPDAAPDAPDDQAPAPPPATREQLEASRYD